jgi:hypothetical protein
MVAEVSKVIQGFLYNYFFTLLAAGRIISVTLGALGARAKGVGGV